ncbi:hypothetical protein ES703_77783 [subsurface metagenome]
MRLGWRDDVCAKCKKQMGPVRLLYPISHKDYTSDSVIAEQWNHLDWFIRNCYFLTVFGYSEPKKDVIARKRIVDSHMAEADPN